MLRQWVMIDGLGCVNRGNRLIQCTAELALEGDGPPPGRIQVRLPLWDLHDVGVFGDPIQIIVPGSTVLDEPELLDFVERLPRGSEVHVIGGCFWNKPPSERATKVWRKSGARIGARDPYTQRMLANIGIESPLIGCPTMFHNAVQQAPCRRMVVPGRIPLPANVWKDPGADRWTVMLHEDADADQIPDEFPGVVWKLYDASVEDAIAAYQNAQWIVTGRLHAALPALGRAPVLYYGDPDDTRNSLLHHLGVPVFHPAHVQEAAAQPVYRMGHAWLELQKAFLDFLDGIPDPS